MIENEIPRGTRTPLYRAFEMLPAVVSYSLLVLVFVLPFIDPRLGAYYVLAVVGVMFFRAIRGSVDLARGFARFRASSRVDWSARLVDIGLTLDGRRVPPSPPHSFRVHRHRALLDEVKADPDRLLHPNDLRHAVIVAAYNEPYDVIAPTIRSVAYSTTPGEQLLVFFAYEERGGDGIRETAHRLRAEYGHRFGAFELVEHPTDLPDEIAGKGSNITYAGHAVSRWVKEHGIAPEHVLVTTLDCDNHPYDSYFDYVAYEYIASPDRKRTAYQPISLYITNIWDAPAVTRVIASANCFWNLTCTVRPFALRNFASHSQPLDALEEMGYWSKRTIVEDGHQYWRSYFHFRGNYRVVPIHVPIYQDAVMAGGLKDTLVAQFKQLSRWSYGASDVPFVAAGIFGRHRRAPFWAGFLRFLNLLEGHISLACVSLIIAMGGWIPFLVMRTTGGSDAFIEQMPYVVGLVQQIAMISLLISILVYRAVLPPRPVYYSRRRHLFMYLQWLLYPATILTFNASTALYSQGRLLVGRYRERFDVTEKMTAASAGVPGAAAVALDAPTSAAWIGRGHARPSDRGSTVEHSRER